MKPLKLSAIFLAFTLAFQGAAPLFAARRHGSSRKTGRLEVHRFESFRSNAFRVSPLLGTDMIDSSDADMLKALETVEAYPTVPVLKLSPVEEMEAPEGNPEFQMNFDPRSGAPLFEKPREGPERRYRQSKPLERRQEIQELLEKAGAEEASDQDLSTTGRRIDEILTGETHVPTVDAGARDPAAETARLTNPLRRHRIPSLAANPPAEPSLFPPWQAKTIKGLLDSVQSDGLAGEIARLAYADALTGLPNRHYLRDMAEHFQKESHAVAFLDIDRFKKINDGFGHKFGDIVLEETARILRDELEGNIIVRKGGEEFVVLLPEKPEEAVSVLERVRRTFEHELKKRATKRAHDEKLRIDFDKLRRFPKMTVSIGLDQIPTEGPETGTPEEVAKERLKKGIDAADQGLYRAKETGRNQVRIFGRRYRGEAAPPLQGPARFQWSDDRGRIPEDADAVLSRVEDPHLREQLRKRVFTADLTGLLNRRFLGQHVEALMEHYQTVIALDLDHLKSINDRHGHQVGDRVLKNVARVAVLEAARFDYWEQSPYPTLAIHLSGEEFLLLTPAPPRRAVSLARGVLQSIRQLAGTASEIGSVTTSIGVSRIPNKGAPNERLRKALWIADQNLYKAKEGGRNQVVMERRARKPQRIRADRDKTRSGRRTRRGKPRRDRRR